MYKKRLSMLSCVHLYLTVYRRIWTKLAYVLGP